MWNPSEKLHNLDQKPSKAEIIWCQPLLYIYKCLYLLLYKAFPQVAGTSMLLAGLLIAFSIIAKPRLLIHGLFKLFRMVPHFATYAFDEMATALQEELGLTQLADWAWVSSHCLYNMSETEPSPQGSGGISHPPAPVAPPNWTSLGFMAFGIFLARRVGFQQF